MNPQDNIQQTGMSNVHPNVPQKAPYDASQQLMPNGGVPPAYPPQQTPFYQGQGAPPCPHQGMQPPFHPSTYSHYSTPPPATQMQTTPGMAPMQTHNGMPPQWQQQPQNPAHPGMALPWQQPPQGHPGMLPPWQQASQNPAQQPNISAPMQQGNYPPPAPHPLELQPGYHPQPAYYPYGWPQGQMYAPYNTQATIPNQYQHPAYGPPPMGTAPGHGYAQPATVSSLGTTSTAPRDSAEQDSVLQSENSLLLQMQNMSLNTQTTQSPDPRQYQQQYQCPDPNFNQPPLQNPAMTPNQQLPQNPAMSLNHQLPQNPDLSLNQQHFQTPDARLSQQTIPTPDPVQSEQTAQVSDQRSSPILTSPRTDEGSSIQVTEGPVSGAGIVPEAPQGTSFASYPVDPSMTKDTERSNSPPSDSQEDQMLKDFVDTLQETLEKLTKDKQTEMVRKALCNLGLDKCLDALEEEFGMDTLFNAAKGRNI